MNRLTAETPARDVAAPGARRIDEFEALYRAEVSAVMAFFARRSSDPQDVFDLAADTFVEAMRSFGSSPPAPASARPWLFAIARRVYARHCEHTARQRELAHREGVQRVFDQEEIEELLARIDAERQGRELLQRLARLSTSDRDALELVDLAGLTPREAARALGVTPGALRMRLMRARARLRKERSTDV